MFSENLIHLRKARRLTQEAVAEKVGVTRQAVAKWEAGDSMPDLETGQKLAQLFDVSLDMLVSFESETNMNLYTPPKGKHLFGIVSVGDKGQIIIPARARKIFDISPGDQLVVLGRRPGPGHHESQRLYESRQCHPAADDRKTGR